MTFQPIGEIAKRILGSTAIMSPEPPQRIPVSPLIDREHWLKLRSQDVTASVAAALLGVHPYVTAYGLWALKSGKFADDAEETPAMRRGRLLEPVAVEMIREARPEWEILDYPLGYYYRDAKARLGATPDLRIRDEAKREGVVQIKNVQSSVFKRSWFDDGRLVPPTWIAVQAIVEAHLTGAEVAKVAALVVDYGIDLYIVDIPLHAGLLQRIYMETAAFWRQVESGKPPDPDYGRDAALLEQMFDSNSVEVVDLTRDNSLVALVDERKALKECDKVNEARLEEIKCELLHKLAGAAAGRIADGRIVNAKRIARSAYTVPASSYVSITVKTPKEPKR